MRKGHSIIGLNVIANGGEVLGKVLDLVFDHEADQCVGLVLSERSFLGFSKAQVLPWHEIAAIGKDAVMVKSATSVIEPKDDPRISAVMERDTHLSGTKIYSTDGTDIGTLGDVYLDEATGHALGYEVSGGFVADTMSGKRYINVPSERTMGDDVMIVPTHMAQAVEAQVENEPGGIKGALSTASDKVSDAYGTAKDKVADTYDSAKDTVGGATANAVDAVQVKTGDAQQSAEEAAIGKPAGTEVNLPSGATLVAPGMIITREIMAAAKLYGKDKEVIASAGLGTASQGAQNAASVVQEKAGSLWDTIKDKTAELTGTAQDKKAEYDASAEQSKIDNALGRPVTRVILAKDDTVILNTGDLITHKAIDHARQNEVLDALLDSVYTEEPEITPEMMRAQGKGSAALPTQVEPTGAPVTATVMPDAQL